ncbi:hypothetical protein GCM10027360_57270 [Amycolatopsis echigonensis]
MTPWALRRPKLLRASVRWWSNTRWVPARPRCCIPSRRATGSNAAVPKTLANRGDDRTLRYSASDFPTTHQVTELIATLGASNPDDRTQPAHEDALTSDLGIRTANRRFATKRQQPSKGNQADLPASKARRKPTIPPATRTPRPGPRE